MGDQVNNKLSHKLSQGALLIAAVSLVGMVLIQGWQVVARYVLNDSPSWTEPFALLLINTAMMFSAAVAVQRRSHFSFQVLADLVPAAMHDVVQRLTPLVVIVIGGCLAWYGGFMALDTWPVKLAGASLRQGAMYVPITLGGLLMVVFAVEQLVRGASNGEQA